MDSSLGTAAVQEASANVGIATAIAAVAWTWNEFGSRCCLLSSMQDAVLIDLAMTVDRRIPIVFLDNGYHFDETYDMLRRVEARYDKNVDVIGPTERPSPDIASGACCDAKVALFETALDGRDAWMSGIRRAETPQRHSTKLIDRDRRGKTKVSPLAQWSDSDREAYILTREILTHPLIDYGFTSIGCAPCTSPASAGARSGRWAGTERTECGLHL